MLGMHKFNARVPVRIFKEKMSGLPKEEVNHKNGAECECNRCLGCKTQPKERKRTKKIALKSFQRSAGQMRTAKSKWAYN